MIRLRGDNRFLRGSKERNGHEYDVRIRFRLQRYIKALGKPKETSERETGNRVFLQKSLFPEYF